VHSSELQMSRLLASALRQAVQEGDSRLQDRSEGSFHFSDLIKDSKPNHVPKGSEVVSDRAMDIETQGAAKKSG
jgi:hypothetical protein